MCCALLDRGSNILKESDSITPTFFFLSSRSDGEDIVTWMAMEMCDIKILTVIAEALQAYACCMVYTGFVTVDRENQMVLVFLDGEMLVDQRVGLLANSTIASNSGLSIGRNSDDQQYHRGMLDDVAMWRRALLPDEVTRIFESGLDGKELGKVLDE